MRPGRVTRSSRPLGGRVRQAVRFAALAGCAALPAWIIAYEPALALSVVFVSDASAVDADAASSAWGEAFGAGDGGFGTVKTYSSTYAHALSISDGEFGSWSFGAASAYASFFGSARSVTRAADGTRTAVDAYESLVATASEIASVRSQFASASSASFLFEGSAAAALSGSAFTRVSGTGIATSTAPAATANPNLGPGGDAAGPISLDGSVSAEATIQSVSDYTFGVVGGPAAVTLHYETWADPGPGLDYQVQLVRNATPVGGLEWIGPDDAGTLVWDRLFPGTYSLIVTERSSVSAYDEVALTQRESLMANFEGRFDLTIAESTAVPELSTGLMTLVGLAGMGSLAAQGGFGRRTASVRAVVRPRQRVDRV